MMAYAIAALMLTLTYVVLLLVSSPVNELTILYLVSVVTLVVTQRVRSPDA